MYFEVWIQIVNNAHKKFWKNRIFQVFFFSIFQDQETSSASHQHCVAAKDFVVVEDHEVNQVGPNHFSLSKLGLEVEEDFSIVTDLKY